MTHFQFNHRFQPLKLKQENQTILYQQLKGCQIFFQKELPSKSHTDTNQAITHPLINASIDLSLLNSCFENLHNRLTRFIQCQSFFTQCDILNDILDDITQIAQTLVTNANSPTLLFSTFCHNFISFLVNLSFYQITLPRYRHYLTKKLLRFEKEQSLIQLGCNTTLKLALQEQIKRVCQDISSLLSGESVYETFIEPIIRCLIVLIEEDHLYGPFFIIPKCDRTSQFNLLTKTLQFFVHVLKRQVIAQRCWMQSSYEGQEGTQLNETVFLLFLKAITQFLPFVFTLSAAYDKAHSTPIDIQNALLSCFQTELVTHFLNLLKCYPISREVITIVGQQVASLIIKHNDAFCITCLAELLCNKVKKTYTWISSPMWYIITSWTKLSLLAKISILRGVISLTSCKQKESLLQLEPFFFFLKSHIQPENHLITFYSFQGIYVWVTCVGMSVSPDLQKTIQNNILNILHLSMDYWNSNFKPLASLCFRTWEACVNIYQHVKELVHMLRNKLVQGDLSKFSLLALSSLISQKISRVYVQQDSFLFLYTLYCICFKKCRNAAIQIILSILQNEQKQAIHSSFNLNSSNSLPFLKLLSHILCETNPFNNVTQFNQIPSHLLNCSTVLKENLLKSFLPILQKKKIDLFFQLLNFLPFQQPFNKNRPLWYPTTLPSFYYWENMNAAFLSSLKELGYGTWDSFESNASLVFSFNQQENNIQPLSLTIHDLAYGLLLRNDLLKYYVLNIICQRREITKFPSLQEWLLVTRFCTLSLTGTTLEFSNKNLDTVKKFLYGACESLKQSHPNVPTFYISQFQFFFNTLLISLGSFISCEATTYKLSLLCHFYQCIHTLPNAIKCTTFSFVYTQTVYCQLIPYIFSSWDKERYYALQCLETFPSNIFYPCFHRFMTPIISLLYSLKHHEQSGAADFIIQTLGQILSNEIQQMTFSTFLTTQKNKMLLSNSNSTQLPSNLLHKNQLNPNLTDTTFLDFTKQFSICFQTTLIDQWIQQSFSAQNALFILCSFDRLDWYISLIQKECTTYKPWNTNAYFLCLTATIQQLPLSCEAFINSFLLYQTTSLREWITTICLKIVNVFFSCISNLFTTCFHSQHDVQQNDIEMLHALTSVAWDRTIDCRGHFVNLTKDNKVLSSSQQNSTHSREWVVIKNAAKTLHTLFQWIHLDSLLQDTFQKTKLTTEFFTHTAVKLIALTLGLKHPAVIDSLSHAISSLTACTARSQNLLYRNLPRQFLSIVTALFIPTQTPHENILLPLPPPLRRSSCLGKCIVALLLCDTSRDHTMNLFEFVMEPILNFLESFYTNFSDLDIAAYFVYNLNVCRSLIQGSLFVTSSSSYLGPLLSMSLHYCIHPVWSVRNAATLLFSTTTEKMTGIRWDVNDTFESYTQSTVDEVHEESCSHGIGFSFCTESQRRFLQRKKGRFLEDIFALYPTLNPLFYKLLDPDCPQHPSVMNEGVVINVFLFLLRVQFVEKQCPLLTFIEYWRVKATNAFTRILAACILSPYIDSVFYQLLQSYTTNNTLHGLLFTLLDYTGTLELTCQNVEHLLQVFKKTFHHTLRSGNRLVAPFNVTLYLQCVETLYQRLESIPTLCNYFKSLEEFICCITETYLSDITKSLHVNRTCSLSHSDKNSLMVTDLIQELGQETTAPTTALNALQEYFPGQSLPLFITALRLFCNSATLENISSFLATFHSPRVSQHINLFILNSTSYCFLEELFRVLSLRFTKDSQPPNLADFNTLVDILTFFFLHTLVKCEHDSCCITFLTNTAREKLSAIAFKTLLCIVKYQRSTIRQHYNQSIINKKALDTSYEDHTTRTQQEISLVSHLAYVVTEALKHSICHEAIFGDPLSQCLIHLKSFTYNYNALLETIGSIFTTCSLPSSPLAYRLSASKILTNVRLRLESFNESFNTSQKCFQFKIWTFTSFLLTDDHEDITKEASNVVKEMLCHFTTFTYLNKKYPLLAEKVCQLTHRSENIITTVSLQYLLRILFLIFDHQKVIDTLTHKVQDDNDLFFPSQENCNSLCFDKEPSRSNIIQFLYYVYSIHAENHTIFDFPFKNCSLLHLDDHLSLEMEQAIQWVSQLKCPFQMYLNTNDTTHLFRLVLHSFAPGENWESKKKQFIESLQVAQSQGILLPLCLKLLVDQSMNHSYFTCISVFPQADFSLHQNQTNYEIH